MNHGGQILSSTLEALGGRCVFGLPGTQNVELFEALRKSSLQTVLATSELAAAFMAVGYGRALGQPGVLATIPGPGFMFALPGIAEASLDSVPLLHILEHKPLPDGKRFRHQEIDHLEIVRPLVKRVVGVESADGVEEGLRSAWEEALSGEPGPVVLWVSSRALSGDAQGPAASRGQGSGRGKGGSDPSMEDGFEAQPEEREGLRNGLAQLSDRLRGARNPVLFLGLGAVDSAPQLLELVELLSAPFLTTLSGRGVIPEDHPLCLAFDFDRGGLESLNELLDSSDLVLALGCKLSHNGTGGFRLKFGEDRLVQVNTDSAALGANYPASVLLQDRVEMVVPALLEALRSGGVASEWTFEEIGEWRARIASADPGSPAEPEARGVPSGTVREVLEILREELSRDAILVTDSGLHQVMVRRHFPVLASRGLIVPSDFQSMGFGLPAAIGASLAAPMRQVVAVIGDGGLAMSGMELLTLAREGIPVTVFVFNDGHLNLIRLQQERDFGHSHCVRLQNPDTEGFAEALGVGFFRLDTDVRERIREALSFGGPALVELPLGDTDKIRSVRRVAATKAAARSVLGERRMGRLKKILKRFRS